jgi:hypothetical protein
MPRHITWTLLTVTDALHTKMAVAFCVLLSAIVNVIGCLYNLEVTSIEAYVAERRWSAIVFPL